MAASSCYVPSFDREIECGGKGRLLHIRQLYLGDVGCVVWDAALVLAKFLENETYISSLTQSGEVKAPLKGSIFWNGKKVVELGSGTGVVGLAAGVLG